MGSDRSLLALNQPINPSLRLSLSNEALTLVSGLNNAQFRDLAEHTRTQTHTHMVNSAPLSLQRKMASAWELLTSSSYIVFGTAAADVVVTPPSKARSQSGRKITRQPGTSEQLCRFEQRSPFCRQLLGFWQRFIYFFAFKRFLKREGGKYGGASHVAAKKQAAYTIVYNCDRWYSLFSSSSSF